MGADSFTITASGGGKTHTATVEVVVPYFTLSMTPEAAYVDRGSSQTFTVTVAPQHGFSRSVTLRVSELGTGLSGSFSRNPVTPPGTSTLTIRASCSASTSPGTFKVTGSGGGYTAEDSDAVTPRSFSVSVPPGSKNLQQGDSVKYDVTVTRQPGFTSDVRLSVSGLPSGVEGFFSPNPARTGSRLTLEMD